METHIHDDELLDQGNPPMGHHSRADATFVPRSLSNGQLIFKSLDDVTFVSGQPNWRPYSLIDIIHLSRQRARESFTAVPMLLSYRAWRLLGLYTPEITDTRITYHTSVDEHITLPGNPIRSITLLTLLCGTLHCESLLGEQSYPNTTYSIYTLYGGELHEFLLRIGFSAESGLIGVSWSADCVSRLWLLLESFAFLLHVLEMRGQH